MKARGLEDARLQAAFATVPRERFAGPGPWKILTPDGYRNSSSDDPALLYEDVVVALDEGQQINNGQPALHARLLSAARVQPGERALHIGCGTGYYTALLAELVTPSGAVTAWDVQPHLVERAKENLVERPNVTVELRSGTIAPIPASDVVYVSAGATQPMKIWVDALEDGGRLIMPLTPGWDVGGMLMVTRRGSALDARFLCGCSFIPCVGGTDAAMLDRLRAAFTNGLREKATSLHFGDAPVASACFVGDGWWLGEA